MAAQAIGSLFVSLGLDSAAFTAGVKRVQTATGRLQESLERIGNAATAMGKRMSIVSGAMAVAGAASIALVRDMSKAANEIAIQSKVANASTREFQRWAAGSKRVGIEQDKLADILKDVNDRVGDFMETGGGPMKDFFEQVAPKVGVTAQQFKNLSGPQALQLYVDTLQKAGLNQQQMTFYLEAMASDATALIPLLQDGGKAMNAYGDAAERSGAILSDAAIKGAAEFQDRLMTLRQAAQGATNRLAEALLPVVNRLMDAMVKYMIPAMDRVVGHIESFARWFGQLPDPIQNATFAIAGIVAAMGPFLLGLGVALTAIGPVITAIKALSVGVAALASPFALAAAAIATAATAIYLNWDDVAPWLKAVGESLAKLANGIMDVFAGLFTGDMPRLIDGFKAIWDGLKSYWQLLWDGLTGIITLAWENIGKPLTDWLGITDDLKAAWQTVESIISTALNGIVGAFDAAWQRIEPILAKLQTGWNRLNGSRDGPISSGGNTSGAFVPALPGQSTPDNMIDGVAVGTGAARAQGAADAAAYEEGWRDEMEIHSPSQVMARIGQWLMQGLGGGIDDGVPGVKASMAAVSDAIAGQGESMAGSMGNFASAAQSAFQSVITGAASVKDALKQLAAQWLSTMASNAASSAWSSIVGAFGIGANANGTSHWRGGLTRINERGEEIVQLPSGSKVFPAGLSKRMAEDAGGAYGIDMSASSLTLSDDGRIMAQVQARIVQAGQESVRKSVKAVGAMNRKSKTFLG